MPFLVDPDLCAPWPHHNRSISFLHPSLGCRDLIDSIARHGQRIPAIVRKAPKGHPGPPWQIVAGMRRHAAITHLRRTQPALRYLIEPQTLTDADAFVVSDLENRARKDLSDHDRARDYARALTLHFNGSQEALARGLGLSPATVSRYLTLARLPTRIIDAYASAHDCRVSDAGRLARLLRDPAAQARMIEAADQITMERATRQISGRHCLTRRDITGRLAAAAGRPRPPRPTIHRAPGRLAATATWRADGLHLHLPRNTPCTREDAIAALAALLRQASYPAARPAASPFIVKALDPPRLFAPVAAPIAAPP